MRALGENHPQAVVSRYRCGKFACSEQVLYKFLMFWIYDDLIDYERICESSRKTWTIGFSTGTLSHNNTYSLFP